MARKYRGPVKDGVTQSLLQTWVDCPRRAGYVLDGWGIPGEKDALGFGSLWHWLLEQDVLASLAGEDPAEPEDLWRRWAAEQAADDADPQRLEGWRAKALPMFRGYRRMWERKDTARKWISAEPVFDVKWENWRLRGRRDAVYRKSRKLWIRETKTTSGRVDEAYEDKLGFDFQSMFYALTAEIEYGEQVAGILYDVTRKPGIRQRKTEDLADYSQRVQDEVFDKKNEYYARYEVRFSKARKAEFLAELRAKLAALQEWWETGRANHDWKNEGACVKRWKCEFIRACAANDLKGYTATRRLFGELED